MLRGSQPSVVRVAHVRVHAIELQLLIVVEGRRELLLGAIQVILAVREGLLGLRLRASMCSMSVVSAALSVSELDFNLAYSSAYAASDVEGSGSRRSQSNWMTSTLPRRRSRSACRCR